MNQKRGRRARSGVQRPNTTSNSSTDKPSPSSSPSKALQARFYDQPEQMAVVLAAVQGDASAAPAAVAIVDLIHRIEKGEQVRCMGSCGLVFRDPPQFIMVALDPYAAEHTHYVNSAICLGCLEKHQDDPR